MPTINSRELVDKIIAGNGRYMDDTPVVKIVEYENGFNGAPAYGVIYEGMRRDHYEASPYVRNPRTLWEAPNGDN